METKGITCKIPLDLHSRISEEMREKELTVSQYIELVIREHMDGGIHMGKTRTLAFQVSGEPEPDGGPEDETESDSDEEPEESAENEDNPYYA